MTLLTELIVVPVSRSVPVVAALLPIEKDRWAPDTTMARIAYGVPTPSDGLMKLIPLVDADPSPSNTAMSPPAGTVPPTQFVFVAQPELLLAAHVRSAADAGGGSAASASRLSAAIRDASCGTEKRAAFSRGTGVRCADGRRRSCGAVMQTSFRMSAAKPRSTLRRGERLPPASDVSSVRCESRATGPTPARFGPTIAVVENPSARRDSRRRRRRSPAVPGQSANRPTGRKACTSNRPVGPSLRRGITSRAMKASVMNGAPSREPRAFANRSSSA